MMQQKPSIIQRNINKRIDGQTDRKRKEIGCNMPILRIEYTYFVK